MVIYDSQFFLHFLPVVSKKSCVFLTLKEFEVKVLHWQQNASVLY